MNNKSLRLGVVTAVLLIASANSASAAYLYTALEPLRSGDITIAYGINNTGQIVGVSTRGGALLWDNGSTTVIHPSATATAINDSGKIAGFLDVGRYPSVWDGDSEITLDSRYGVENRPFGINAAGQIVGEAYTPVNTSRAILWEGAVTTPLDSLGGNRSGAFAINAAGQIVGYSSTSEGRIHATLWNGTTPTDLGHLGGGTSYAMDINNHGVIVGDSYLPDNSFVHATLWDGATMIDLGTPNGTVRSFALAINNSDQVVGYSDFRDGSGRSVATLWNGTTAIDLNDFLDDSIKSTGLVLARAVAINDRGWIVGWADRLVMVEGQEFLLGSQSFLLTPIPEPSTYPTELEGLIPEPSTYALLLAGLTPLGFMVRGRNRLSFQLRH